MITVTIGGNDADFADVLSACVFVTSSSFDFTCNEEDLATDWQLMGDRVETVIAELKRVAPDAAIFVLGYPYVTPPPSPCPASDLDGACPELGSNASIDDCAALSARPIITTTLGLFGLISPGVTKIDHVEADFLRRSADALNVTIRGAADRAGAHFVGVASPSAGHSPCDPDPWLHGYVLDTAEIPPASGRSFHPTARGHAAIARLLEDFIGERSAQGAELNEAGLPLNPTATR